LDDHKAHGGRPGEPQDGISHLCSAARRRRHRVPWSRGRAGGGEQNHRPSRKTDNVKGRARYGARRCEEMTGAIAWVPSTRVGSASKPIFTRATLEYRQVRISAAGFGSSHRYAADQLFILEDGGTGRLGEPNTICSGRNLGTAGTFSKLLYIQRNIAAPNA